MTRNPLSISIICHGCHGSDVIFHGQPVFSVVGEGCADSASVLDCHVPISIIGEGHLRRPINHRHQEALIVQSHAHRLGAFCLDGLEVEEGIQGVGDKVGHWAWLKSRRSESSPSLMLENSPLTSETLQNNKGTLVPVTRRGEVACHSVRRPPDEPSSPSNVRSREASAPALHDRSSPNKLDPVVESFLPAPKSVKNVK